MYCDRASVKFSLSFAQPIGFVGYMYRIFFGVVIVAVVAIVAVVDGAGAIAGAVAAAAAADTYCQLLSYSNFSSLSVRLYFLFECAPYSHCNIITDLNITF